jgi:hypothetical protein
MNSAAETLHVYAKAHGGGCTYPFRQADAFKVAQAQMRLDPNAALNKKTKMRTWDDQGKLYKMILRGREREMAPMGGVCATVCAFWVVFHAKQDSGGSMFTRGRSVWDYLFNGDGLNMGAAQNIAIEHHKSTGDQLNYLAEFMKKFNIVRRTKAMSGSPISPIFIPFNMTTVLNCAHAITAHGGYKLLQYKKALDGSGAGHMTAAWSDGTDVLFMDPNMGEFWLPTRKAFGAWLMFYWSNFYGSYKSLRVHNFVG